MKLILTICDKFVINQMIDEDNLDEDGYSDDENWQYYEGEYTLTLFKGLKITIIDCKTHLEYYKNEFLTYIELDDDSEINKHTISCYDFWVNKLTTKEKYLSYIRRTDEEDKGQITYIYSNEEQEILIDEDIKLTIY